MFELSKNKSNPGKTFTSHVQPQHDPSSSKTQQSNSTISTLPVCGQGTSGADDSDGGHVSHESVKTPQEKNLDESKSKLLILMSLFGLH